MRNIEINEVYTLFEEIKKLIKKGNDSTPTIVQPEIELPDLSAISELTDKLQETIKEVRKPAKTECHHIFSIASNKIFFSVIGMGVALLVCMFMICLRILNWSVCSGFRKKSRRILYASTNFNYSFQNCYLRFSGSYNRSKT